jgi:hypothetical protein
VQPEMIEIKEGTFSNPCGRLVYSAFWVRHTFLVRADIKPGYAAFV